MDKVAQPMQKANPAKGYPFIMYKAGYYWMGEQLMPLMFDLHNVIHNIANVTLYAASMHMHHLTMRDSG